MTDKISKEEFWHALKSCCGMKYKYDISINGTITHTCRGCGEIVWSNKEHLIGTKRSWGKTTMDAAAYYAPYIPVLREKDDEETTT